MSRSDNEERFWELMENRLAPVQKVVPKTLGDMAWEHIESDMHLHDIEDLVCFYESEYDTLKDALPRDALEYFKIVVYLKGRKVMQDHCE